MQMQEDNKASLSLETESGGTFPSFPPFSPLLIVSGFAPMKKISFLSLRKVRRALSVIFDHCISDRQTKVERIIAGEDQIGSAAAEAYQSSVMRTRFGFHIDWSWSLQASSCAVLCMTQPVNIIHQKQHLSLSSGTEELAAGNVHIQKKRNLVFRSL